MLVSEEKLPKDQRATASKDQVLDALECLERAVERMTEDPMYEFLETQQDKIRELSFVIKNMNLDIESDTKGFDRWQKSLEGGKKIAETVVYLREHTVKEHVISNKSNKTTLADRARR